MGALWWYRRHVAPNRVSMQCRIAPGSLRLWVRIRLYHRFQRLPPNPVDPSPFDCQLLQQWNQSASESVRDSNRTIRRLFWCVSLHWGREKGEWRWVANHRQMRQFTIFKYVRQQQCRSTEKRFARIRCNGFVANLREKRTKQKLHVMNDTAEWRQYKLCFAIGQGHVTPSRTWINTFEYSIGCSAALIPSRMPNLIKRFVWVFSLLRAVSIFRLHKSTIFTAKNHNKNSKSNWLIFLILWQSKANYDYDFCDRDIFYFGHRLQIWRFAEGESLTW